MFIDVGFDIRSDLVGANRDPDAASPGLARYHQTLWGRPLPDGTTFTLHVNARPPFILTHTTPAGDVHTLTSDTVLPTYLWDRTVRSFLADVDADLIAAVTTATCTIGGTILWPGNRINGGQTINQARGLRPRLRDRFDLTIECVRRHYRGEQHPLADVFARYRSFFDLFVDFRSYVEFWLLDDLIDPRGPVVEFHPSDDFTRPPIPRTAGDYARFAERTLEFVTARNTRIAALSSAADGDWRAALERDDVHTDR